MMFRRQVPEQPVYDQEGEAVDMRKVQQDKHKEMHDHLLEKLDEFEQSLRDRCDREGIDLEVIGWHPDVQGFVYILGREVYAVRSGPNELHWSRIQ